MEFIDQRISSKILGEAFVIGPFVGQAPDDPASGITSTATFQFAELDFATEKMAGVGASVSEKRPANGLVLQALGSPSIDLKRILPDEFTVEAIVFQVHIERDGHR
ncbi:hypothetical protein SAOR_07105 [Salinisphaera orenii MK-B5]|uniref:Uncharacterized protein n=1 Tax=Salinisphaera orenii MK-B5 TaxID=856730 RepID=A0A423PQD9_9GAMM|nr:hypothetical protein SAOR_07105 [Salinisphaera orenii MK-B5]